MSAPLTPKEIYERMQELRNIKKLHEAARRRVLQQHARIKELEAQNTAKDAIILSQAKMIQQLHLRVEELERMVFGKKKKQEAHDPDTLVSPPKPRTPRSTDSYHRPIPTEAEVTHHQQHTLSTCPACGGAVVHKETSVVYEEDIVLPAKDTKPGKTVTKHTVERGYCPHCHQWHSAVPHLTAAVFFGEKVQLYICYLSIIIRLSFGQIATLLDTTYALSVSDGEIAKILLRESRHLRPAYEALKVDIRRQKGVHYDETPWKVGHGGQGNFAWVMTGAESTDAVFVCGKSRGKGVAEALVGESPGVGISDDYGVYRNLFRRHQLCFAHPHRKLRDLATSDTLERSVKDTCRKTFAAFGTLYQDVRMELAKEWHAQRNKAARGRFMARLRRISVSHPDDPKKLTQIKEGLGRNLANYFTCLLFPGIPCDNNKAERALRHLVLKRKVSFGSKTAQGAEATAVLLSVLLSLFWRKPNDFFGEYMALRGVGA